MILVVNADDFGLTEGTNRAIINAHQTGIVTSTSMLANGQAFDHAIDLARQNPNLGIGVHLTLNEGVPVSDAPELRVEGEFPLRPTPYVKALLMGRLPRAAIRREFEAQIQKVIEAGIQPTHVDGHKYIHLLPGITDLAVSAAHKFNIPIMRIPRRIGDKPSKPNRAVGMLALMGMSLLAYPVAHRAGLRTSDRLVGFVHTGHLTQDIIRDLLAHPKPGITELLCHPAIPSDALEALSHHDYRWIAGYEFETETAAVSDASLRAELESAGWSLRRFGA
jgi:predicted glycoside hydrolase/deacetylase ChbG (UPF0249 family)